MKKIDTFNFDLIILPYKLKYSCKVVLNDLDTITIDGESIEDVLYQLIKQFPNGINFKMILFSGDNVNDSKANLAQFMILGAKIGYFNLD